MVTMNHRSVKIRYRERTFPKLQTYQTLKL